MTEIAIIETLVKGVSASNRTPDRTPCSAGRLEQVRLRSVAAAVTGQKLRAGAWRSGSGPSIAYSR